MEPPIELTFEELDATPRTQWGSERFETVQALRMYRLEDPRHDPLDLIVCDLVIEGKMHSVTVPENRLRALLDREASNVSALCFQYDDPDGTSRIPHPLPQALDGSAG